MGDHAINVNINFGNSNANFQQVIDKMNVFQGDINKLGGSIQDFSNKTTGANAKGQKSITDYAGAYSTLTADIKKNRAALLEELSILQKLRDAKGVDVKIIDQQITKVKQLESSIKQQTSSLNQYNKALGITKEKAGQAQGALGSLTKGFNSLGAVLGISFGAYGAFRVLTGAIKIIAEFDLAQKKLQSVLGETKKGMAGISESAIQLGRDSIFGAKGVTELQIELAKMGFTKTEIMAMQEAINNLAIATQEDLGTSAEVVANILKTFNLSASESTRVVDVMGKSFNASALDLTSFREAIKYVAPVAKQAGFSLEETVAVLELLSNAGLKGSLAGTGFNNVLKAMMDSNSKLSKSLGGTVQGYEGFISVLTKAKEEGWSMSDVFGVITQRATGAFSILKDGVPILENFKEELLNVSGVIRDQAAVQLDSITYKAKLFTEQYKTTILELDKGDSSISRTIKKMLELGAAFMFAVYGGTEDAKKKLASTERELFSAAEYAAKKGNATLVETLKEQEKQLIIWISAMNNSSRARSYAIWQKAKIDFQESNQSISELIIKSAEEELKRFDFTLKNKKAWEIAKQTAIDTLVIEKSKVKDTTFEYKVLEEAITKVNKISFERESIPQTDPEKAKKALQDRIQAEIDLLELQKKLAIEKVKLEKSGSMETVEIGRKELEFDKLINAKKLELAIASGKKKLAAEKEFAAQGQLDDAKFFNTLANVWDDAVKLNDKSLEEMNKNRDERFKDAAKQRSDDTKDLWKWLEEQKKAMFKESQWKGENPLWSALGFDSDNDDSIKALEQGFDKAKELVTKWADKWVEQTDRIVDAKNNMVDEAQQSLETEIALADAGFASNVTLRQKDLADAKKARDESLVQAKKARKAQAAIETAEQVGALITASAKILMSMTKDPISLILGIGTIAAMLASFVAFKAKASSLANTDKYETGGWIRGNRHTQGGVNIEAEDGEFVINRNAAAKHPKMIEAINNNDMVTMNRLYINGLKNGILETRVSLDDSHDLKAIRAALEKNSPNVSYYGNYRVEKRGNVTTRIQMS